jgi:hypothetical protein
MKIKLVLLFFFLLIKITGYALDIETLPSLRSEQHPLAPYEKVVIFSAPRTGSSLTYNVFKFLFEKDTHLSSSHEEWEKDRFVLKTHRFQDLESIREDNILYVVTVRNPIAAGISNYRIAPRPLTDIRKFAERVMLRHQNYITYAEGMKKKGVSVLFVKYEELDRNMDYLFTLIEQELSLSIKDQDKELMKEGYAKKNVHSSIQNLPDFKEFLPISGFHGNHIDLEPSMPPKELLYWLDHYLVEIKPFFQPYGYFLD